MCNSHSKTFAFSEFREYCVKVNLEEEETLDETNVRSS